MQPVRRGGDGGQFFALALVHSRALSDAGQVLGRATHFFVTIGVVIVAGLDL